MRIVLTGAAGLLGQKVAERALAAGHEVIPVDMFAGFKTPAGPVGILDITDREAVRRFVPEAVPDWVVNTAAYTAVDESERDTGRVHAVNVAGVGHLQEASEAAGARLLTISTDYVFDGTEGPYEEDAPRRPLGAYGASKAAMEDLLQASAYPSLIVRTMVLYGAAPGVRANFALWVVSNLRAGRPIRVVTDQMGNPTLAADLARMVLGMMEQGGEGVFHAGGRDRVSRHEFACAIAREFELDDSLITPITTAELDQHADRPLESGFVMDRMRERFGIEPAGLPECLQVFAEEYRQYGGTD